MWPEYANDPFQYIRFSAGNPSPIRQASFLSQDRRPKKKPCPHRTSGSGKETSRVDGEKTGVDGVSPHDSKYKKKIWNCQLPQIAPIPLPVVQKLTAMSQYVSLTARGLKTGGRLSIWAGWLIYKDVHFQQSMINSIPLSCITVW